MCQQTFTWVQRNRRTHAINPHKPLTIQDDNSRLKGGFHQNILPKYPESKKQFRAYFCTASISIGDHWALRTVKSRLSDRRVKILAWPPTGSSEIVREISQTNLIRLLTNLTPFPSPFSSPDNKISISNPITWNNRTNPPAPFCSLFHLPSLASNSLTATSLTATSSL